MIFWIVAALILAVCITAITAALLRDRPAAPGAPDVEIYRDQLAELERDAARGTLAPEEAEAARAEVARRLLAADRRQAAATGPGARWLGIGLVAVPVVAVSLATYLAIGAPGYGDMPLAGRIERIDTARRARPSQETAEVAVPEQIDTSRPEITEMAGQLREVLAGRPDDLRGWELAVTTFSGLGDMRAAWRAQDRVVAIRDDDATGEDFAVLGELMVIAAGGYVSPEAERAFSEAVRRDPENGLARYYAGLMYAQGGRPDLAFRLWQRLVADSAPDDPWLEPIYAQIEEVSVRAGDPTALDELPQPSGPTGADIAASAAMTPEDRVAMIGGMVEGLATRLATEGGSPADWARLITSFGVLGRTDDAAAVYAEAKSVFAESPDALDLLAQAADDAGLAR
ncbi:c-type cytochrome biogenesis protein CcmI [uncultured Jannaschia sp.]|uniref:c-type cytochrome biogenesis protein CcmI n=1 Tax=uncultured Jannaschia sp. TaxID=293347 RepID=UPI00260AC801|nr:c-type cytochrome biogenesis protein CcmI [uncultured Jannaschia sp.]